MRLARQFLVNGRVQNVGFRFFARDAAAREGLHGWVRNLDDGRVQISAEGESESIDRFERAIRRGPSSARVDLVEVSEFTATGSEAGFEIR